MANSSSIWFEICPIGFTKKGQLKSWPFLFYWATVFSAKVSDHDAAVVVQPKAAAFES
jgi:hypothetical protein